MVSSRSSFASSWNLSLAGKGRNNNRNRDSRSNSYQQRSSNPVQAITTQNKTTTNEFNNSNGVRKNRYSFTSLMSSGDKHSINKKSRLDKNETPSAASSFPETTPITIAESPSPSSLAASSAGVSTPSDQAVIASDVNSDIMEFGSNVEFDEDSRRHIHAETLEIEASNEATREAVSKEHRTEEQLTKDLERSKTELCSLNQGIEDQFESANMFWTFATNLRREFVSRIVEVTKPAATNANVNASPSGSNHPHSSYHPVTPDVRNKEGNDHESDSPSNDKYQPSSMSNQEILAQKASRSEKMLQALKDATNSLEVVETEINGLKEKQNQLETSMEFQGLQESLERAKEEERRAQSEILQDRDTEATRVVEIQQLHESCGTKAQKCTDLEKEFTNLKKSNAAEEGDLRQQIQTIQADVESLLKKKEETMLQIELEKRNIERSSNEIENYNYYCKVREDDKRKASLRKERKKELLALQAEAMRKLMEAGDEEKASLLRKQKAQEAMTLVEAKKVANAETENKMVLPGKTELARLSERKVKLAEQIAEASKNAEKEQVKESEALAAKLRAKNEAISLFEKVSAEYKAKQEEIETTNNTHQEFIRSHNEQIASHASQAEKFVQLQMTERGAYERRLAEGKERWSEKLLHHVKEQERVFEAHAYKAEVIEQGILMLQDAEKDEREAHQAK